MWRAALMLLVTAVALHIAWRLLEGLLPALLVISCLLLVLRLAVGRFRGHSDW